MELIVDLHIHSHYSRATSKNSTLEGLYKWGKIKGINVIGTGDFTHPGWFEELREKLDPAEEGLYKLKDSIAANLDKELPKSVKDNLLRFILTVEISNIYSKNQKVRKMHNLIIAPNFETVSLINSQLDRIGNLKADGRPILGLDSKDLLKISLESNPDTLFIPAHIWTPWFAMFGSKSGFDSIEEAFDDLSGEIKAIETGLSSDPFMNWRVGGLKGISIISNSDAHSPEKLGREATIIDTNLKYKDIVDAIKKNDERLKGTIEFFPEEGKYHYDGHRVCSVSFTPDQTKSYQGICPKCQRPLTVGVDYRVSELTTNNIDYVPENNKSVEYIIPLIEILSEIKGVGPSSKTVKEIYDEVIRTFGNEFDILRSVNIDDIKRSGFIELAYGIDQMRQGKVYKEAGYDGVYGVIKLFNNGNERVKVSGQISLL